MLAISSIPPSASAKALGKRQADAGAVVFAGRVSSRPGRNGGQRDRQIRLGDGRCRVSLTDMTIVAASRPGRDMGGAAARRELDRVRQEVDEDLAQPRLVAAQQQACPLLSSTVSLMPSRPRPGRRPAARPASMTRAGIDRAERPG